MAFDRTSRGQDRPAHHLVIHVQVAAVMGVDRARTAALFAALSSQRGQVLLTTTRPELIETGALSSVDDRRDFRVVSGQVLPG